MKKIFLFTVIVSIFSTSVFAEWVYVGSVEKNASDQGDLYVDTERITMKDNITYYWELTDYHDEGGYGYLSDVTKVMLDCQLRRYKNIQVTNYKGAMATGVITGNDDADKEWKYPLPKTIKESSISYICNFIY